MFRVFFLISFSFIPRMQSSTENNITLNHVSKFKKSMHVVWELFLNKLAAQYKVWLHPMSWSIMKYK